MADAVRLEHFRNLVSLSAADGKITDAERESLERIASSLGIPPERLQVMLSHAHEYIYLVPQNTQDRDKQLQEMIALALVDGEFASSERELIKSIARKLGFVDSETESIINNFLK